MVGYLFKGDKSPQNCSSWQFSIRGLWFLCPMWHVILPHHACIIFTVSKQRGIHSSASATTLPALKGLERLFLLSSLTQLPPNFMLLCKMCVVFINYIIIFKSFCPGWCGSVVECRPVNQRVTGSIPSLGHMPGLQARSPVGGMRKATTHWCFSPSLSLPLSKK